MRIRITFIYSVQKDDTWVARLPGDLRHQLKDFAGVELAGDCSGAGVDEVIILIALHPLHELFSYGH